MEIQHEQSVQDASFYIEDNGNRIAETRYTESDGEMDIYHTEVAEEYQGQHLGDQLIEAAVKYARDKELKIYPSCSFAQAIFGRKKEYRDVLAKS